MNLKKKQPNNRYRRYTLDIPSDTADRIKRAARAESITEQAWIERAIAQQLFATPASAQVPEPTS